MLQKGICRPSSSAWASPLLLVPKDAAVTVADRYALPHSHDFAENLAGKNVFTKLDLVRAYHRVPIAPNDVHRTAVRFIRIYRHGVMCFGLRNAAQTYQRVIDDILRGLDFVFAFISTTY